MNQLLTKISQVFHSEPMQESMFDIDETRHPTAAVISAVEPSELHKGRRRVKESHTSHWDLDYLPRDVADKIMTGENQKVP